MHESTDPLSERIVCFSSACSCENMFYCKLSRRVEKKVIGRTQKGWKIRVCLKSYLFSCPNPLLTVGRILSSKNDSIEITYRRGTSSSDVSQDWFDTYYRSVIRSLLKHDSAISALHHNSRNTYVLSPLWMQSSFLYVSLIGTWLTFYAKDIPPKELIEKERSLRLLYAYIDTFGTFSKIGNTKMLLFLTCFWCSCLSFMYITELWGVA